MMQLGRIMIVHQTGMFHDIMRISHAIFKGKIDHEYWVMKIFSPRKQGLGKFRAPKPSFSGFGCIKEAG